MKITEELLNEMKIKDENFSDGLIKPDGDYVRIPRGHLHGMMELLPWTENEIWKMIPDDDSPLFWLIVGGTWGPVTLMGYAFLRAWQYWLARYQTPHHRLQSGIDAVLHVLDWVPVRLAGVVYALIGHGEKALPAWFASLGDFHTSQYQVLTRLAQFSLAREPHVDKVETPKAAVSMAKKTSFVCARSIPQRPIP